ncbi:CstA-like transporter-associated (seleno)protein [Streptomyces sp. NPDC055078]
MSAGRPAPLAVLRRAVRAVHWYLRELTGESAYDRHCERLRRDHPHVPPPTRREFQRLHTRRHGQPGVPETVPQGAGSLPARLSPRGTGRGPCWAVEGAQRPCWARTTPAGRRAPLSPLSGTCGHPGTQTQPVRRLRTDRCPGRPGPLSGLRPEPRASNAGEAEFTHPVPQSPPRPTTEAHKPSPSGA